MTTAKAIEEITDRGLFEKLANAALRKIFPKLKNLVETGTNAKGETIRDPFDAFCVISNDHFAMIAHTTSATNLEGKWLNKKEKVKSNSPELGDLVKIIRNTAELRKANPDLRVSAYLSTNQHVSSALLLDATAMAKASGIELIAVDQSNYADFLNNTADGQYLRKQYLKIDTELLSAPLLKELMAVNLADFKKINYIDENILVETQYYTDIIKSCDNGAQSLTLLSGSSGFGKSTLCYMLLETYRKHRWYALRITPEVIEASTGIYEAIEKQLQAHHPNLYIDRNTIKELFNKRTLLVIDDVNKSQNPLGLIDRVIALSGQLPNRNTISIICPVWPKYFDLLKNKEQKEQYYQLSFLDKLSYQDASLIINKGLETIGITLTGEDIRTIIKDTAQDPLLLNLFIYLIKKRNAYLPTHGLEVILNFVNGQFTEIADKATVPLVKIKNAFEKFGYRLLAAKLLNPAYNNISTWFTGEPEILKILELAGQIRSLFYFEDTGSIVFRHDRVRDYIMSLGLHEPAADISTNSEIFGDPYFAELIAHFIAQTEVSAIDIETLLRLNPLGVFQSLKYLQSAEKEPFFETIMEKIKSWNAGIIEAKIPKSVLRSIAFSLVNFDTKNIADITQGMPSSIELYLARFRNGNCIAGLEYLAQLEYFSVGHHNFWWDTIIEQVRTRYLDQYIRELNILLRQGLSEKGRTYAYLLAGYLKSPKLVEGLMESWNAHKNENDYVFFLWGILNCIDGSGRVTLEKAFWYWRNYQEEMTPDKQKYNSTQFKPKIKNEFRQIQWGLNTEQIAVLNSFSEDNTVNELIFHIFGHIDSPVTLALLIKMMGGSHEEANGVGRMHMKVDRWDYDKFGSRLSVESLQFLKDNWINKHNKKGERKIALRFWMGNENEEVVLKTLRHIDQTDEDLYDTSIFKRVFLGDASVVTEYLLLVERKPHAIGWADQLWNSQIKVYFRGKLESYLAMNDENLIDIMMHVLRKIDQEDAAELLNEFWESLKHHLHSILTALYLATDNSRALALAEIYRLGFNNWATIEDFYSKNANGLYIECGGALSEEQMRNARFLSTEFRYADRVFGCRTQDLDVKLTIDKLNSLIPFMILLSQEMLESFGDHCQRFGFIAWMDEYLYPFFNEKNRAAFKPSDEDLIAQLTEIVILDRFQEIDHFIERLEIRRVTRDRFILVLAKFIEREKSLAGAAILNKCLIKIGKRRDLILFDAFKEGMENWDRIEGIKLDTAFMVARNTPD